MLIDRLIVASVYSNMFNILVIILIVSDPLTLTFTISCRDDYGCRHGCNWSN